MSKKKKSDENSSSDENSDRSILQRIKEKSEDDFERNITYISAGALAISLTFLEKIVPVKDSTEIWLVILSWTLLVLTLLSNLLSHQYSSYIIDKTIDDVDDKAEDTIENWTRRTKKIRRWNFFNVIGLIIGIGLFIIFVSINVTLMSKQKNVEKAVQDSVKEQYGRTPMKPAPKTVPTDSTKSDSTKTDKSK